MCSDKSAVDGAQSASIFAALGDPTRLALLDRLSDGEPRSISMLTADTDLTRQAITKHLHVLEGTGLVSSSRSGRESRFVLQLEPVLTALRYLEMVAAHWDEALFRLRKFIEEE